jgi:hypothetical protein
MMHHLNLDGMIPQTKHSISILDINQGTSIKTC